MGREEVDDRGTRGRAGVEEQQGRIMRAGLERLGRSVMNSAPLQHLAVQVVSSPGPNRPQLGAVIQQTEQAKRRCEQWACRNSDWELHGVSLPWFPCESPRNALP